MANSWNDWLDASGEVTQEELLLYLQGKLPAEDQQRVEQWLLEHPEEAEAMEGLQQVRKPEELPGLVHRLNHELHQKLRQQNSTSHRKWLLPAHLLPLIATVIIILLVLVAFYLYLRSRT